MKIDVVISDRRHPLWPVVAVWAAARPDHQIAILDRLVDAGGGDCLVMVACHEIAALATRRRYRRCFVTHASDLPRGRGWSPVVWDVLEGKDRIVLSLVEATDPDSLTEILLDRALLGAGATAPFVRGVYRLEYTRTKTAFAP